MVKFIKKPIEIEAFQITKEYCMELVEKKSKMLPSQLGEEKIIGYEDCVEVYTLEGTMKGNIGDYIIIGVEGELYPCKQSVFDKSYTIMPEGDEAPEEINNYNILVGKKYKDSQILFKSMDTGNYLRRIIYWDVWTPMKFENIKQTTLKGISEKQAFIDEYSKIKEHHLADIKERLKSAEKLALVEFEKIKETGTKFLEETKDFDKLPEGACKDYIVEHRLSAQSYLDKFEETCKEKMKQVHNTYAKEKEKVTNIINGNYAKALEDLENAKKNMEVYENIVPIPK